MPLEKKQVLPNLFRYVCDSCSFDWPRTPVKEGDLPPPPAHSCPNENRPAPKPVPEEQEKVISESTKPRPRTICVAFTPIGFAFASPILGREAGAVNLQQVCEREPDLGADPGARDIQTAEDAEIEA